MRRESAHRSYLFIYLFFPWPECESLWAPEEKRGGFEAEIKKISARNKTKIKNTNRKYVSALKTFQAFHSRLDGGWKEWGRVLRSAKSTKTRMKRWLFLFRDFENYLFIFSKLEASHHIEEASHCTLKGKKKSLCTAGSRWRKNIWHEPFFFYLKTKLWLCHR